MKIISPAFQNNTSLPTKYSCDGAGVNPPLVFSDIPTGAKSLVLIVDDPDAPNGTFTHWIVYNISPSTTEIEENSIPQGATLGKNSLGKTGFVAACPPNGQHRYIFTLFALDSEITQKDFAKAAVESAMHGHILASSQLIGLYSR